MAKVVVPPESLEELFGNGEKCSRCDDAPVGKWYLYAKTGQNSSFTLRFCSEDCRERFVQGFNASQELKDG